MSLMELLTNRCCECASCGDRVDALRLLETDLCEPCEELLLDLEREHAVKALLGKPWWFYHNPFNAKAFRDVQKGVFS